MKSAAGALLLIHNSNPKGIVSSIPGCEARALHELEKGLVGSQGLAQIRFMVREKVPMQPATSSIQSAGKPDALQTLRASHCASVFAKRLDCGELAPAFAASNGAG